jgi:hypothetical protein
LLVIRGGQLHPVALCKRAFAIAVDRHALYRCAFGLGESYAD